MKTLSIEHFDDYFRELHGYLPFSWQRVLAERICRGDWPRYLKAPTASGKTSLVDIAIFAMAIEASLPPAERKVPRRVFFVVDRRIVVDETYRRGLDIACALRDARSDKPVLQTVRERLLHIAGDGDGIPLDCVQLRGGIYRDDRWVRSPTQPTIIASTVDQVGSRLLFRGYGVSEAARPIHAALVGNDALIVLDEAHLSQPFSDTLRAVDRYRQDDWATQPVRSPFRFIEMTATPPRNCGDSVFAIDDPDVLMLAAKEPSRDERLHRRRRASKPTRLVLTDRTKGKKQEDALVEKLVEQVKQLSSGEPRAVAVIVNRVATARRVHELLNADVNLRDRVDLMIGRMRPIDRDDLAERLRPQLKTSDERPPLEASTVLVATQCLEVGADFDFDVLVTQCASIDALRQRFGRLNRAGREITAQGVVVMRADEVLTAEQLTKLEVDGQEQDPIYGTAMARTWNWLNEIATEGTVDFGLDAMTAQWERLATADEPDAMSLQVPSDRAPALFPAYLDRIAQTSPTPEPDLDVSLFLHGRERNDPEVQVCWRADLSANPKQWAQIVSLLPPSSSECLSVPISVMRRWLTIGDDSPDTSGDVPTRTLDDEPPRRSELKFRPVLMWRGTKRSDLATRQNPIRPGDTLVLPVSAGGWNTLGYIPDAPDDPSDDLDNNLADAAFAVVDQAERAFVSSHDKAVVRLHHVFKDEWPTGDATKQLFDFAADPEQDLTDTEKRELLEQAIAESGESSRLNRGSVAEIVMARNRLPIDRYPDGRAVVIKSRDRIGKGLRELNLDDGDDELSAIERDVPVTLADHTRHVCDELSKLMSCLPLSKWQSEFETAAWMHDWGKADERFQALLLNSTTTEAGWQRDLLAKSARLPKSARERTIARKRSGLPEDFRHELLSVSLAEASGQLPHDDNAHDLILHLVATHHGYARPFAPPSSDRTPPAVDLRQISVDVRLSEQDRLTRPAPSLNNGHANRFWRVLRRFGWWGAAYLEAILRLADQRASALEDEPSMMNSPSSFVSNPAVGRTHSVRQETIPNKLLLNGLDGGNSLAFLAALGMLRTLSLAWPDDDVALSWSREAGVFRPQLHANRPLDEESVIAALHEGLRKMSGHRALGLSDNLNVHPAAFADFATEAVATAHDSTDKLSGRVWSDFAAAFGCSAAVNALNKEATIQDTALRTMSGAGHQHFLKFMRDLISATEPQHLQQTLFEEWRYEDEGRGLNMRWDPEDDRRYALRWDDPSSDPSRTVRGANRLGIEAIPMLVATPVRGSVSAEVRLETTGFKNLGRKGVFWTWPIWSAPLSVDACRALLTLSELQSFGGDNTDSTTDRQALHEFGILAVYRCERIRIGKFRNFTATELQ